MNSLLLSVSRSAFAAVVCAALSAGVVAADAPLFPATLAGHALLPARSFIDMPTDAPADLRVSGKFTTGVRTEKVGSVMGQSDGRDTGLAVPFQGQPLQGHSGIKRMADGSYWVLTDNGFGNKRNSTDSALYLNRYAIDFKSGSVKRLETIFLRDPDKKVPFRIVQEGTRERYLTGGDFDPESFQFAGGSLWIGEEFGPYLIQADLTGKVLAVFETVVDGKVVRSPDHPAVTTPGAPGGKVDFVVSRSKGFEGMAASPDGRKLYPLLEGPLFDPITGKPEQQDGKTHLRVLEFDVPTQKWTGRHWKYALEDASHAIGDFNLIDAEHGLIIERDNFEGVPQHACAAGQKRNDCFATLPKFKRVYKVQMNDANVGGFVRKIGAIDLLAIQDPANLARKPHTVVNGQNVLQFPFFTIENVDVVDAEHIIVGNDNNLPYSSSRLPNAVDDNEFILLNVKDLLRAK